MQRLKNYAMLSLTIAALSFPSTTSSQMQDRIESSPSRTQQPAQSQGSLTPPGKFMKSRRPIPNRYIVVLNDDVVSSDEPLEVRRARITAIANSHAQTYGGKFDNIYETALKGYAIALPNEAAAIAISNLPEVRWVEEESFLTVDMRADTASSKSFELPESSKDSCRGKSVPVSLMEHPFGIKLSARRVPFLPRGISQRARLVIRSRDEFNELWKGLFRAGSDKPPLPEIDFSREMIIVAAMGQRGTTGYEILIDGACEVDNRLEVRVRSTNYLNCRGAYMVETEPVDIVRFPKTDLQVVFRETDVTSDCKELSN